MQNTNDDMVLLKKMQKKQMELLKELDRVCKILKIKFYLSSGTCLGALRHGGFIPWDDDVDTYMFWEDAQILEKNRHLFAEKYFLQCRGTEPNVRNAIYRLRDSNTSWFTSEEGRDDINHGILMDIYILYPYPDNSLYAHKVILDSFVYRTLLAGKGPQNHGRIPRLMGDLVCKMYSGERAIKKIDKIENEYKYNGGKKYYATYYGRDATLTHSIVYPKEWFDNPVEMKFEDMTVNCPRDIHAYCTLQYGDTYMQLPPEEKRKPHHDFVFCSVDEPYTKYKGIYYDAE